MTVGNIIISIIILIYFVMTYYSCICIIKPDSKYEDIWYVNIWFFITSMLLIFFIIWAIMWTGKHWNYKIGG